MKPDMKYWRAALSSLLVSGLLALGSCSKHPLAGGWHEHTKDGAHGLELEFDAANNHLTVHGRPRADGTHDHFEGGSYTLTGDALSVQWTDAGKKVEYTGTLKGDVIALQGSGGDKLEFHRGGGH